jgi:ribosomal protein L18E
VPTFLSDPSQGFYLILAAIVLVAGVVWFNRRDRKCLLILVGAVAALAAVIVIDLLFESPREESVRRVLSMVQTAENRDQAAFLSHIAERFTYQGDERPEIAITRDQLRQASFWDLLRIHDVHVAAWDFSRADVVEVDDKTIEIGFLAKGETGGRQLPLYFRATFTRQSNGEMKLTKLESYDPIKRTNERKSIPGFP